MNINKQRNKILDKLLGAVIFAALSLSFMLSLFILSYNGFIENSERICLSSASNEGLNCGKSDAAALDNQSFIEPLDNYIFYGAEPANASSSINNNFIPDRGQRNYKEDDFYAQAPMPLGGRGRYYKEYSHPLVSKRVSCIIEIPNIFYIFTLRRIIV